MTPFFTTPTVRGQNLSAGTERADGVCVSECVHGRDNPQIARAVKHYREQQTDSKDGCEHRYRERRLREQVVIVQRAERVEQIADENSRQRAPAPDELRLQHASIQHFLVETVNQVRNKYGPEGRWIGQRRAKPGAEEDQEDDIDKDQDLNEVGLLREVPPIPSAEPNLANPTLATRRTPTSASAR